MYIPNSDHTVLPCSTKHDDIHRLRRRRVIDIVTHDHGMRPAWPPNTWATALSFCCWRSASSSPTSYAHRNHDEAIRLTTGAILDDLLLVPKVE